MSLSETRGRQVEALRVLNNTIVTCRLYPADAPQAAQIVDRGYKGLKKYVRENGPLEFSINGEICLLNGEELSQEIIASFPNLIVFRQLRFLQSPRLILRQDMDRFCFGRLVVAFNSSQEEIRRKGGAYLFLTSLGLAGFFPEDESSRDSSYSDGGQQQPSVNAAQSAKAVAPKADISNLGSTPGKSSQATGTRLGSTDDAGNGEGKNAISNVFFARPELVAVLLDKELSDTAREKLTAVLEKPENVQPFLVACIAHLLQVISRRKTLCIAPGFALLLQRADEMLRREEHQDICTQLAGFLISNLRDNVFYVLLCQPYPEGFGSELYNQLVNGLSLQRLGAILGLFREKIAAVSQVEGMDSERARLLDSGLQRLSNSNKGRTFLSSEKARQLIEEGEKNRRKKRVEAGFKKLLQGDSTALNSEELLVFLPDALRSLLKSGHDAKVAEIIVMLRDKLLGGGGLANQHGLGVIVRCCQLLKENGQQKSCIQLLDPIKELLLKAAPGNSALKDAVRLLHTMTYEQWNNGDPALGDAILQFLHDLRTGRFGKYKRLREIVSRVQDRGIQLNELPRILNEYLQSPQRRELRGRLVQQGPVALRFLVDALIEAEDTEKRIVLLDLLGTQPEQLPAIIAERLKEHMPWYGKRNLIKLLGETGREEDVQQVLPYLCYDDIRVQKEAFLCLYKISGNERKKMLLVALEDGSELVKIQAIRALAVFADKEVGHSLCELLGRYDEISEKNRADLMVQLFDTLARCHSNEARTGFEEILKVRGRGAAKKLPPRVWQAAEKGLRFLDDELQNDRKKHIQANQLRKKAFKKAAKPISTGRGGRGDAQGITSSTQEQTIRALVSQGDLEEACKMLIQLIERTARARNFNQAEKLREWLIEINPNALSTIIETAEIIEREKIAAIDSNHLEIWSRLYDTLNTDEFTTLYHAMEHRTFNAEEMIARQGFLLSTLFFVNSGKIKVFFDSRDNEVLVKTLGPGEVLGAGAFFEASVWTISAASVTRSEVSLLNREQLSQWSEDYPGLESTLREFCEQFERIEDYIEKSSRERRAAQRYRVGGRTETALIDNRSQQIGVSSSVELFDISEGGVSYQARISSRENARMLLGRKIRIGFDLAQVSGRHTYIVGEILAVRSTYAAENDYSVHVRFDEKLDSRLLMEILEGCRREA